MAGRPTSKGTKNKQTCDLASKIEGQGQQTQPHLKGQIKCTV